MEQPRNEWTRWNEQEVAVWLQSHGLSKYAGVFVDNEIKGCDLSEVINDENALAELIQSPFWRKKVVNKIAALVSGSSDQLTRSTQKSRRTLPPGKKYDYFGSHKKDHSVHANASEQLCLRVKDVLEVNNGIVGFFDVDDLKQIDQKHINEGILASCCLLAFLNDESMQSRWVRKEWECARDAGTRCRYIGQLSHLPPIGIPIVCVVDTDHFPCRPLIKAYVEAGYNYLFTAQVITYTSAHRKGCYDMIAAAIDAAVEQTKTSQLQKARAAATISNEIAETKPIHQSNVTADTVDTLLRQLVLSNHESVEKFFEAAKGKGDVIGRTDWKKAVNQLGLNIGSTARKDLRKRIAGNSKTITLEQLLSFIGSSTKGMATSHKLSPAASGTLLCAIPLEVPSLPQKFHPRDAPLGALIASLVEHQTPTVSLTAPKAKNAISSQGMGGCGKTTLTIAAIRDPKVRRHFDCIAWQAVSQAPNISEIQSKLFIQLFERTLPDDASTDVSLAFKKLEQGSKGRTFLVCLDDVWDSSVEQQLNFLDETTPSRLLISTRIRGLISGATEVQLALLSPKESVEMLIYMSGVSADAAGASTELMKISDLCCRLPLTVGIAAGMIQSFGSDWQGNVLGMLQEDASAFMAAESETGVSPAEVIVLRSVKELDADTQNLFTLLGLVPEDTPCPVAVTTLIWISGQQAGAKKRKCLLKVRKMTSKLIKYNVCLGSVDTGVFYHDIVRDVARGAIGPADNSNEPGGTRLAQRKFIQLLVEDMPDDPHAQSYLGVALAVHVTEALLTDPMADVLAQSWLDHSNDMHDLLVLCVANAMGPKVLVALADIHENKLQLWLASKRLLNAASTTELVSKVSPEIIQLNKRASELLSKLNDESSRTLELATRGIMGLQMSWSDEYMNINTARLHILLEANTMPENPRTMYQVASAIFFSRIPECGCVVTGAGNHQSSDAQKEFSRSALRANRIWKQCADSTDNEVLKLAAINMVHCDTGTMWSFVSEMEEKIKLRTLDDVSWATHTYSVNAHHAEITRIVSDQMHGIGATNFLNQGAISIFSGCIFPKLAADFEDINFAATPTLFVDFSYHILNMLHPCFHRAGVHQDSMSRVMRACGSTFLEIDATVEIIHEQVLKHFYFSTDEFQYSPRMYWIKQIKYRHWLISGENEIELRAYTDWLPSATVEANSPVDITAICVGSLHGGCASQTFESIGRHQDGIASATIDLANQPFVAPLVVLSNTSIGRCHSRLGHAEESKAAFRAAIAHAQQCHLSLLELFALSDSRECGHATEDELPKHTHWAEPQQTYRKILSDL